MYAETREREGGLTFKNCVVKKKRLLSILLYISKDIMREREREREGRYETDRVK